MLSAVLGMDLFEDADEALTLFWKHRRRLDDLSEDVCALRASLEFAVLGGRTGIRTLERVAPLTVFKTVAFVRSAILPPGAYRRICPISRCGLGWLIRGGSDPSIAGGAP
jgi:hypothetical protein